MESEYEWAIKIAIAELQDEADIAEAQLRYGWHDDSTIFKLAARKRRFESAIIILSESLPTDTDSIDKGNK